MNRHAATLIALCALWCISIETGTRYGLPAISRIQRRVATERAQAATLRPIGDGIRPVLLIGNSLLGEGVNVSIIGEELGPEFKVTRFVLEDTFYLDWYYGLRRLFREGARPGVVVLVLAPGQLVANRVRGDYFAHALMDGRDLLRVKRDLGVDNTFASNLLFANLSGFCGYRVEIRKWVLAQFLPEFRRLTPRLQSRQARQSADEYVRATAKSRLQQIANLCSDYGARFVLVVPPSNTPSDGSNAIRQAGEAAGVAVLLPFTPQQMPTALYTDGFHLNADGALAFTHALAPMLRKTLRNGNLVQESVPRKVAWQSREGDL